MGFDATRVQLLAFKLASKDDDAVSYDDSKTNLNSSLDTIGGS